MTKKLVEQMFDDAFNAGYEFGCEETYSIMSGEVPPVKEEFK